MPRAKRRDFERYAGVALELPRGVIGSAIEGRGGLGQPQQVERLA